MIDLKLIAAVSLDGAIGNNNELIWNVPEDLQRYKKRTSGNVVIVGLNTFMGMPKQAFANRTAIVVCGIINEATLDSLQSLKVYPVSYPEDAIALAEKIAGDREVFVIGGEMIYAEMIDNVNEAEITWINKTYPEANKRFPIDKLFNDFEIVGDQDYLKSIEDLMYKFTYYKRN